jgi:hypothetical protein
MMDDQPPSAGERASHLATLALSETVIGVDTSQGLDDTGIVVAQRVFGVVSVVLVEQGPHTEESLRARIRDLAEIYETSRIVRKGKIDHRPRPTPAVHRAGGQR